MALASSSPRATPERMNRGTEMSAERDAIRSASNEILLRKYNEQIEARHKWVEPSLADWVCECADEECAEPVKLTIQEYEAVRKEPTHFLVVPGNEHVNADIEVVVRREERYWIVEKVGVGAEMSQQQDPRRSR